MSRNERDVTAVAGDRRLILDGEVVAPDSAGHPSFSRLRRRMNVHQPTPDLIAGFPLRYNVFDLLGLDGKCWSASPTHGGGSCLSASA
jgi:bifunctional non-homologous end joining protein LigD